MYLEDYRNDPPTVPPRPPRWWIGLALILLIYLLAFLITLCRGASVTLAWDASTGEGVAGYELRYGQSAGNYHTALSAGSATEITVPDLVEGETYYFVVYALSDTGLTSAPSNEVAHTVGSLPLAPPMDRAGWVITASSDEPAEGNAAKAAIDGDDGSFWHTAWKTDQGISPHFVQITLPEPATVSMLYCLARQDGHPNGRILAYEIQSSLDGSEWEPWATGEWSDDMLWKTADLPLREVRHLRIWSSAQYMAAAEIELVGSYVPKLPMASLTVQRGSDLLGWQDFQAFTFPRIEREFFRLKIETP